MKKKNIHEWLIRTSVKKILLTFYSPRTPRQVKKITGINKLNLAPLIEKNLLQCLNSNARKGRLYTITDKARKFLQLPPSKNHKKNNWNLLGWLISSPKQRLVILRIMDTFKRTSEEIREKAMRLNPKLTRISTKSILQELINNKLIDTRISGRKRYYWITETGMGLRIKIERLSGLH